MSRVHAVLLLPAEGDPLGLLSSGDPIVGVCAGRPSARWCLIKAGDPHDCPSCEEALVLAVGQVEPASVDRLAAHGVSRTLLVAYLHALLRGYDPGVGPWPGTLILLDADGREVQP